MFVQDLRKLPGAGRALFFFNARVLLDCIFEFYGAVHIEVAVKTWSAKCAALLELELLACSLGSIDAEGRFRLRGEEDPSVEVTILLHVFHKLAGLDGPHFFLVEEHIN